MIASILEEIGPLRRHVQMTKEAIEFRRGSVDHLPVVGVTA